MPCLFGAQRERGRETGKSSLNLSHAACVLFYEVFRAVREGEGKFREIPEQSTRAFKPLPLAAKDRLKALLLQSRRLLDVGDCPGDCESEGESEGGGESEDAANLQSFIARNSLSAKDATVLFHLAQRVVALGHLSSSSSLLAPALEQALRAEARNTGTCGDCRGAHAMDEAAVRALVKKGESRAFAHFKYGRSHFKY